MARVQVLRALVEQRLSAAVEEIFVLFERTVAEYEEELCRSEQENQRHRKLLDAVLNPRVTLQRAECVVAQEVPAEKQESSSSGNQDSEPPVKEEPENTWTTGEQLQEPEEPRFIAFPLKSEKDNEGTYLFSQLEQDQTEEDRGVEPPASSSPKHLETDADGGPEPDGNGSSDGHLHLDTHDESSDTEDSEDERREKKEPQSRLNSENNGRSSARKPVRCRRTDGKPVRHSTDGKPVRCRSSARKLVRCRSTDGKPVRHSTDGKPVRCRSTDGKPVRHSSARKPVRCRSTDGKPVRHSTDGKPVRCRSSARKPVRCHSTDGKPVRHSTDGKPVRCRSTDGKPVRCRSTDGKRVRCRSTTGKTVHCSVCHKGFQMNGTLMVHMRTHTGEKPYSCSICGKVFSQNGTLTRHLGIHRDKTFLTCYFCGIKFDWFYQVREHRCDGKSSYCVCSLCGVRLPSKTHLVLHIRENHSGQKLSRCPVCKETFRYHLHLIKHMKTHREENRYKCLVCKRGFIWHDSFVVHMKKHAKDKTR